jgi:hypothetical protein
LEANAHIALGQLAGAKELPDQAAAQQHHEHARRLAKEIGDVAGLCTSRSQLTNP